jgi:hypothetical protein
MKKSEYILKSFINAGGTFVYVLAIAWFFSHIQNIFDSSQPDSFLAPLFMLLLFIISASVTSLLVFGKPIMMYMSGLKRESLILLFATLGWLVVFVLMIAIVLLPK